MYRWFILALALPCATGTITIDEYTDNDIIEDSETNVLLHERYVGGYYYYPQRYYNIPQREYRPYSFERPQAYFPQQPYHGYYRQPNYTPQQSRQCTPGSKERLVSALESTMGTVENARQGLEQVLMRLRYRPSIFEFPRTLLETARTATSMVRDLHEVLSSVSSPCLMQSKAHGSTGDTNDDDMKERFAGSLMNMKKSAKSLESAVAQLFESPFKAFTNIGEVFTDLKDSLTSAMEAVMGDDNDDDSNDNGASTTLDSGSSSDSGFAAFTSYSFTDSSTPEATSTEATSTAGSTSADEGGDFDSYTTVTTELSPTATDDDSSLNGASQSGNSDEGLTRRFTFTAEEMLTFTNMKVLTFERETFTKEFHFTTAEYYRFTDTSVFVEDIVATAASNARSNLAATITPPPHRPTTQV